MANKNGTKCSRTNKVMIVATPNGGKKRRKNQQQNQPEVGVCLRSQSCCAIPAAIVPSAQPTSPTAVDSPQRQW